MKKQLCNKFLRSRKKIILIIKIYECGNLDGS